MEKNLPLVPLQPTQLSKINRNLKLVEKIIADFDLQKWWQELDEPWKSIFRKEIDISKEPQIVHLRKIINLEEIYCVKTDIKNLNPLIKFKHLKQINLMMCEHIENIEPLKNNKNLRILDLTATKVNCIEVVEVFEQLEELLLSNYITDVEPLKELIHLRRLFFRHCFAITSLEPLSKLVNLEELVVSDTVTDLTPILGLNKIKRLVCYGVSDEGVLEFKTSHPEAEIIHGETEKIKNARLAQAIRALKIPEQNSIDK